MATFQSKPMAQWAVEDVVGWVSEHGMAEIASKLAEHCIDGEAIVHLNTELLNEMGIVVDTVCQKLLNSVKYEMTKRTAGGTPKSTTILRRSEDGVRTLAEAYMDDSVAPEPEIDELLKHTDRFGFIDESADGGGSTPRDSESARRKQLEKEKRRLAKWSKMMEGKPTLSALQSNPKFKPRVYKGIPDVWRLHLWELLIFDGPFQEDPAKTKVYESLSERPTADADESQIDLDINRTLRNNINYRQRYGPGQRRLFKVLRAYANHNPEIGFCQGMANVAAFLHLYFDEEKTFWVMDRLASSRKYLLEGMWTAGFPGLMESFFIHQRILKMLLPKLWKHFHHHGVHPSAYATRWYMTVFLGFPFETSLRVWDLYLMHGFNVLYFVAMASLEMFQAQLLSEEFEGIMEILGQLGQRELDNDAFVQKVVRLMFKAYSSNRALLQQLRKEYKVASKDGPAVLDV